MTLITMYHVSPTVNAESIKAKGVDPAFSEGKKPVIWIAEKSAVSWALSHVSSLRKLPTDQLTIFRLIMDTDELIRTNRPGIYNCAHVVGVYMAVSPMEYFEPYKSTVEQILKAQKERGGG